MSHFFTVVIVPGSTAWDQIIPTVARLLAPYDEQRHVTQAKHYLDEAEILHMAAFYHVPPDDLGQLARLMLKWANCEGGVDERGLYQQLWCNPQARWDWWEIGGRWNGVIRAAPRPAAGPCRLEDNVLPAQQLDHEVSCFAVATPDGVWHARGLMGALGSVTQEKDRGRWRQEVIELFLRHRADLLVGIDCHI